MLDVIGCEDWVLEKAARVNRVCKSLNDLRASHLQGDLDGYELHLSMKVD